MSHTDDVPVIHLPGEGGELSQVVTDLLAIMQETAAPTLATGTPDALPILAGTDGDKRGQLKQEFQDKYQENPPGTRPVDAEVLYKKRWVFTSALSSAYDATVLTDALHELATEHARVVAQLGQVRSRRKQLAGALDDALPAGDPGALVEGASAAEAQPLFDERARIAAVLEPPAEGAPEVDLATLNAETDPIIKLAGDTKAFVISIKAREAVRKRLTAELALGVSRDAAGPDDVVPGATVADVAAMLLERTRIADALRTATGIGDLNAESTPIATLRQDKAKLVDAVNARLLRKAGIETAAQQVKGALHAESDPEALDAALGNFEHALATLPLADTDLNTADLALDDLREVAATTRGETMDRIARRTAFKLRTAAFRTMLDETANAGGEIDLSEATNDLKGIETELDGNLWEVGFDDEPTLDDRLHNLRASLDTPMEAILDNGEHKDTEKAAALIVYLTKAAQATVDEAERLTPFLDDGGDLLDGLTEQQTEVLALLKPSAEEEEAPTNKKGGKGKTTPSAKKGQTKVAPLPGHAAIKEAFDTVTEMRRTLDAARESADGEAQLLAQLRLGVLDRIEPETPPGLPPGFPAIPGWTPHCRQRTAWRRFLPCRHAGRDRRRQGRRRPVRARPGRRRRGRPQLDREREGVHHGSDRSPYPVAGRAGCSAQRRACRRPARAARKRRPSRPRVMQSAGGPAWPDEGGGRKGRGGQAGARHRPCRRRGARGQDRERDLRPGRAGCRRGADACAARSACRVLPQGQRARPRQPQGAGVRRLRRRGPGACRAHAKRRQGRHPGACRRLWRPGREAGPRQAARPRRPRRPGADADRARRPARLRRPRHPRGRETGQAREQRREDQGFGQRLR